MSGSQQGQGTNNNSIPPEGPKTFPVLLTFAQGNNPITVNMTQAMFQGQLSMIQSVFLDNSQNDEPLSMTVPVTQQTIVIPPYSQAYVPTLSPNPPVFVFSSAGATVNVNVNINNFSMPLQIWSVNGSGSGTYTTSGALVVSDLALDGIIQSGALNTRTSLNSQNDIAVPDYGAGQVYIGTISAGSTSSGGFLVGNPGAFITYLSVFMDPDAHAATAGNILIALKNGGTYYLSGSVYVPASAPTLSQATKAIQIMEFNGQLALAQSGGTFSIVLATALAAGNVYWVALGGQTATVVP